MRKRAACVLILNHNKTLVLAVSRKDNPNDFGLVGGKVEDNETFEQAAKRELFEESGLIANNLEFVFEGSADREYHTKVFHCTNYSGNITQSEEGIVKFVPLKTITEGSFGAFNIAMFKYLSIEI